MDDFGVELTVVLMVFQRFSWPRTKQILCPTRQPMKQLVRLCTLPTTQVCYQLPQAILLLFNQPSFPLQVRLQCTQKVNFDNTQIH